jgi:TRAP-type C4-dicarboxylate transport system substrate-binding protein
MEKKIGIMLFVLTMIFGIIVGDRTSSHSGTVIKWKLQNAQSDMSYGNLNFYRPFAEAVKQKRGGRLQIEVLPTGALVKPRGAFGATRKGVIQAVGSISAYAIGMVPEAEVLFGIPGNFKTYAQFQEFFYEYKNRAFLKLADEAYREKGVHLLAVAGFNYGLHTKFAVNSLDDLKGKKVIARGSAGRAMSALGATPISLSGVEWYQALQTGTADAVMAPVYGTRTYSLFEVTSQIIFPPLSINTMDITVNLDAYNKLPDDLKKIVDDAAVETAKKWDIDYRKLEAKDVNLAKSKNVKVITLSDKEMAKFKKIVAPIWDKAGRRAARSAIMVDLLREYQKEKGY